MEFSEEADNIMNKDSIEISIIVPKQKSKLFFEKLIQNKNNQNLDSDFPPLEIYYDERKGKKAINDVILLAILENSNDLKNAISSSLRIIYEMDCSNCTLDVAIFGVLNMFSKSLYLDKSNLEILSKTNINFSISIYP
jgi:hypothetical protein